jgi:hypothetical protein
MNGPPNVSSAGATEPSATVAPTVPTRHDEERGTPPRRRLVAGAAVFAGGWIATLVAVSAVRASSLPSSVTALVLFVGPKLGVLAAIGILGKPGFAYLKTLIFGYLTPAHDVGAARHRVGVAMFVVAMVAGFFEPYGLVHPRAAAAGLRYSLAIDLLLVASVFVLGGNFWSKVRALFVREARACFP